MSVPESPGSPNEILTLSAASEFENNDQALESLVQLKELDFGEEFINRDTKLETDEGESISIHFHHDDKINTLYLTVNSETNIMITLSLGGNDITRADSVLERIFESTGNVTIKEVNLYKIYDVDFNSLQLPISDDTEHQVTGIKITHDNREYIIQQESDEKTSVNMVWSDIESNIEDCIKHIGESTVERTTEFIQSFY